MGREKGTPKTGGRKRGTPNKYPSTVRERISKLVLDNFENIENDIITLEKEKRVDAFLKLLPYAAAKLSPIVEEGPKEVETSLSTLLKELSKKPELKNNDYTPRE